ncbi:MAG: hypothetical protein ACRD3E_09455 [Terriglobales bacterium]
MKSAAERAGLREGDIYVDLDGTPVRLVQMIEDVCCWVPFGKGWNDRQQTLASYFRKRFRHDPVATARARKSLKANRHADMGDRKVRTGHGTYLLHLPDCDETPASYSPSTARQYRVGERVPQSGIYRVVHEADDMTSAVILLAGSLFPYCASCGIDVHFQFDIEIPRKLRYQEFDAQALEITHPVIGAAAVA